MKAKTTHLRGFIPCPEQEPILAILMESSKLTPKIVRRLTKAGFTADAGAPQPFLTAPTQEAFDAAVRRARRRRIAIDVEPW